jgi:hypothetical protein
LTFLPTNTTSRKWLATPLRHDATLTKSRSDVSRPTDAFRNIVDAKLLNRVSPSLISLRTYLMVADALTKSRSDVSRPTDAFRNICLGGQICIATSSMPSCSTVRLSIAYFAWGRLFTCLILLFTCKTFIHHSKGSASS